MDITELKQELLDGKVRSTYVFTGDELALQDVYIDKIKELSGLEIVRVETLLSIFSKVTAKTLFKIQPKIYIIRNDEYYYKTESAWKQFLECQNFRGNIVILLYSGVENKSKFCNAHENILTRFDFIGDSMLVNRLQATTGMPAAYCADIVKKCGCNYGRIKNELYKLNVYAVVNHWDYNMAYLQSKKCDLIHEDIGDIIFEFTNAVESRNIKKAYELWPKMKYTGDGPMRVLSVLYNSFRQILMVQSTPPNQQTEEVLGMTKGQIFITSQKCFKYNIYEVVNIVKTLRYLEKGIKIGTIAEDYAMDYLMGVIW